MRPERTLLPRIRNLDLNLLKVFNAVYNERNISRAAQTLYVSQPAVSNALRRLRELYDDPPFTRSGDGMIPTPRAQELAEQVSLSPTPCLRRLRRLEQSGVVTRYTALLDREAMGSDIYALAFVSLTRNSRAIAASFEKKTSRIPEVMEVCVITGAYDYLLSIVSQSLQAYEKLLKEKIASQDEVAGIETSIVLNQILYRTELPLSVGRSLGGRSRQGG
ncbi:MAG: LysR family transcriptional regulator [Gammaproteobacteria bacterium]|nr:LysR family transcriptional regulator [Gammaproteobacteria bacterium]